MTAPRLQPTEDLLKAALTNKPRPGLVDLVFADLTGALDQMPQRPSGSLVSRLADSLRLGGRSRRLVPMVLVALLAVALLAIVGLAGAPPRRLTDEGPPRSGLVGFDSGGHLYIANADGSDVHQLTSGSNVDIGLTFSPDGKKIAYQSLDPNAKAVRLIVMRADGSDPVTLATSPARILASGTRVAFPRVSWSPDGRRLAYTELVGGSPQIVVIGADGTGRSPLAPGVHDAQDPAWSPDGTELAFRAGRKDADRGVYLMRVDGLGLRRLSTATTEPIELTAGYSAPMWSTEGDVIAFTHMTTAVPSHVWLVAPASGLAVDVSPPTDNDWAVVPSPVGQRLAWLRARGSGDPGQFVVADSDGSDQVVLPPVVSGTPVWSPDGTHLIGLGTDPATASTDRLVVVDIGLGTSIDVPAVPDGDPSWQRKPAP